MADSVGSTSLYSYEDYVASQKIRTPNQDLGKDEFLSLLVAQMQYQDPLEPTSDTDFIAQLAQFSSLEQMNQLNNTMTMFQSYSLAGKYVYGVKTHENGLKEEVAGFVTAVINDNGTAWAQVGDVMIKCSQITEVFDGATATGDNPLLGNINLIGKYIEGQVETTRDTGKVDEDGNAITEKVVTDVKGIVDRVAVDAKQGMVAYVTGSDGEELMIPLANIKDVRASAPASDPTKDNTTVEYTTDEDGNLIFLNGRIEYANGDILDEEGNMFYFAEGRTEYANGDIGYADGSVDYADGSYLDAGGVLHETRPDASGETAPVTPPEEAEGEHAVPETAEDTPAGGQSEAE